MQCVWVTFIMSMHNVFRGGSNKYECGILVFKYYQTSNYSITITINIIIQNMFKFNKFKFPIIWYKNCNFIANYELNTKI